MTAVFISASLINKLKPKEKEYDVRDTAIDGFLIRVHPSGRMSYVAQYARGRRINVAKVGEIKPDTARTKANEIILAYKKGIDPREAKLKSKGIPTLQAFLDNDYGSWVKAHNISGDEDIKTIHRHFGYLLNKKLNQIEVRDLEKWRAKKLETKAMKANTINRTITPLRSMISKAVEWGIIDEHVLKSLKILKCDDTRVRYLSEIEVKQLFDVLYTREAKIKKQRASANEWRKKRGKPLYPELKKNDFTDHFLPMMIVTLNTGVRRSELLRLKRQHVNLEKNTLFVEKSKNYMARYMPLNKTALKAIKQWLKQTEHLNSLYVFPSPLKPEKHIVSIKTVWNNVREASKIKDLRWHDLRHDFASKLVMKEVSLYTVQKLLGHKKIGQTMKYAHLAPSYMAESVGRLDG